MVRNTRLVLNEESADTIEIIIRSSEQVQDPLETHALRHVLQQAKEQARSGASGIECLELMVQGYSSHEIGTTVVAAISSAIMKMYMPTHIMLDRTCGLKEKSIVMLEQGRTVDKSSELKEYIGMIRDSQIKEEIKRGIATELGLRNCPRRKRNTHV